MGLTAYVQRNAVTREWTLEAGALVLVSLHFIECLLIDLFSTNAFFF